MALSDLAVFSEYAYSSMTEILRQKIDLFNAQTRGSISLSLGANQGDYSDEVKFAKISGLVRRRNAYGTGSVTAKTLTNLTDTSVKVSASTPPIQWDASQFRYIQRNPEEAGVIIGTQLAPDMMADMLNVSLGTSRVALSQVAALLYDATGNTAPDNTLSFPNLNNAQAKFGDQSNAIVAWVMHSKPIFDLYAKNLGNISQLFTFGSVNVSTDPFGKLFVTTDSPNLIISGSPNKYAILGLTQGAVTVEQNNDFFDNVETKNGNENIAKTYQAEWTYNVGIKGFAWDKTNGGKSPNDSALFTATNWDRYATSEKDCAGVVALVN